MVSPTARLAARTITRVSARAFVHPEVAGGGNPVDVFLSRPSSASDNLTLPPDTRSQLAKSCAWESVIAYLPSSSAAEQGQRPVLSFYMPSGEEVSFCAHAALGAASVISQEAKLAAGDTVTSSNVGLVEFTTTTDEWVQSVSISPETGEAELKMSAKLTESDIPDFITLGHVRDALGLRMEDVSLGGTGLPSYINSSIARNKTLLPMLDEQKLQTGPQNPKDPEEWKRLCDKIDSTGVYLYSPVDSDSTEDEAEGSDGEEKDEKDDVDEVVLRYECRQFPRASGYPEDPATGIAAAALAASLRKRGFGAPLDDKDTKQYRYEFYQGTSMGRRSRIGVRFDHDCNVKSKDNDMEIYISGLVDISSREEEKLPSS